jgi:cardiolipin synthase
MKLLVQPTDGIMPVIEAIEKAKKSIDIVIFRFNRTDVERVLENAVARGIKVHALIAYLNRGGEKKLRKLEMRLLEAGVTVARTSDDLVRYHDKFMIIDGKVLCLFAFNFTYLDIDHSRAFGVIVPDDQYVQEAAKLFEADVQRRRYVPEFDNFIVSPVNARKQLEAFIKGAKESLMIYDPKISDRSMIRLLEERARAGVEVQIVGRLTRRTPGLNVRRLFMRLHARTIVRDRREVFIGSQSLSEVELDLRREVGIITDDSKVVEGVVKTFEDDWTKEPPEDAHIVEGGTAASKSAKKAVKASAKELPPVVPILEEAVRKVVGSDAEISLDAEEVEETVRNALKEVVKEVVKEAVQEVVVQEEHEKQKV